MEAVRSMEQYVFMSMFIAGSQEYTANLTLLERCTDRLSDKAPIDAELQKAVDFAAAARAYSHSEYLKDAVAKITKKHPVGSTPRLTREVQAFLTSVRPTPEEVIECLWRQREGLGLTEDYLGAVFQSHPSYTGPWKTWLLQVKSVDDQRRVEAPAQPRPGPEAPGAFTVPTYENSGVYRVPAPERRDSDLVLPKYPGFDD